MFIKYLNLPDQLHQFTSRWWNLWFWGKTVTPEMAIIPSRWGRGECKIVGIDCKWQSAAWSCASIVRDSHVAIRASDTPGNTICRVTSCGDTLSTLGFLSHHFFSPFWGSPFTNLSLTPSGRVVWYSSRSHSPASSVIVIFFLVLSGRFINATASLMILNSLGKLGIFNFAHAFFELIILNFQRNVLNLNLPRKFPKLYHQFFNQNLGLKIQKIMIFNFYENSVFLIWWENLKSIILNCQGESILKI